MSFPALWLAVFVVFVRARQGLSYASRAWRKLTGRRLDGFAGSAPRTIPRQIWAYWDQGEAAAPPIVRACLNSWRTQNPDWTLTVLDRGSALEMADLPIGPDDIAVQAYTDLLRLRLLARQGGVWVDATTFCLRPLDHWLPVLAQGGFFAFTWTPADRWFIWPNVPRRITTWFLASEKGGAAVTAWEARSLRYWKGRRTPHVYYWVHLIWDFMAMTDRSFGRLAAGLPKIGAFGPHLVHDHVQTGRDSDMVRVMLQSGAVPFQKLRWNWSEAQIARAREVMVFPDLATRAPDAIHQMPGPNT